MYKEIILSTNLTTDIARLIVEKASRHDGNVSILYDNKKVNAKSIMGVLSLSFKKGEVAFIEASGEDAENIIDIITKLI